MSSELEKAASIVLQREDAWAADYWPNHRLRISDDIDLISQYPGRVLEVGASPYFTTLALHMQGRDVVAVDIDPGSAPQGIHVVGCDIEREQLPVPDASFDVVVFSEVFEHLRIDPLFTMSELRRVLKPDGTLLLTTPNLRSLRGVLRLVIFGKGWAVGAYPLAEYTKLAEQGWMGHVREYTAREVTGLIEACGFTVTQVVWRRKPGTWWQTMFERAVPPSRPYMTLVASAGHNSARHDT